MREKAGCKDGQELFLRSEGVLEDNTCQSTHNARSKCDEWVDGGLGGNEAGNKIADYTNNTTNDRAKNKSRGNNGKIFKGDPDGAYSASKGKIRSSDPTEYHAQRYEHGAKGQGFYVNK